MQEMEGKQVHSDNAQKRCTEGSQQFLEFFERALGDSRMITQAVSAACAASGSVVAQRALLVEKRKIR